MSSYQIRIIIFIAFEILIEVFSNRTNYVMKLSCKSMYHYKSSLMFCFLEKPWLNIWMEIWISLQSSVSRSESHDKWTKLVNKILFRECRIFEKLIKKPFITVKMFILYINSIDIFTDTLSKIQQLFYPSAQGPSLPHPLFPGSQLSTPVLGTGPY